MLRIWDKTSFPHWAVTKWDVFTDWEVGGEITTSACDLGTGTVSSLHTDGANMNIPVWLSDGKFGECFIPYSSAAMQN